MSEKYVCQQCIEDEGLQECVAEKQEEEGCSYCGQVPAAPLEDVVLHMMAAISTEYGDIEDNLDVDGQVPDHCDIEGVFRDIWFRVENEDLMNEIIARFGDRVFTLDKEKDFLYGVRIDAWHRFQHLVKHDRRYTFASVGHENNPEMDELLWSPGNLLANVARTIHKFSLVVPVERDTEMWRVRVHHADETLHEPKEFTSPPLKYARYANRMSPAGVPMFYGAEDFDTAVSEVVELDSAEVDDVATGMAFRACADFGILDLTARPRRKGFFDRYNHDERMGIDFLHSFATDLAKPIKKDGREHIEYVPSQVFTEHVRYEMKGPSGEPIKAIKYASSKNGQACYVIFVEQPGCLPSSDTKEATQLLEPIPGSLSSVPVRK